MMNSEVEIECSLFYVDDDPDDLQLFKEVAESFGEKVCVFQFPELMLYSLNHPPPVPSIIFVDLNMPSMNGFEVIKKIKNSPVLRSLPIIVYSTSSRLDDVLHCRELGASLFVTKPTRISDLKKVI